MSDDPEMADLVIAAGALGEYDRLGQNTPPKEGCGSANWWSSRLTG